MLASVPGSQRERRLDQINPIGKLVAICSAGGKVLGRLLPAHFNGGNETIRNQAVSHMGNQSIDCGLPPALGDARGDFGAHNDARITLGERNKDQLATAIWMPDFASRSASFCSIAVRVAG
jgi:hypothetical protein